MNGKHTCGPWFVRGRLIEAPSKTVAALSKTTDCEQFRVESEANARLIAAAPDLLDACKQFLVLLPGVANGSRPAHPDVRMAVNAARAAIAKATG